jgi:hypothetical protein
MARDGAEAIQQIGAIDQPDHGPRHAYQRASHARFSSREMVGCEHSVAAVA